MKLRAWGLTDVGQKREHNEDSLLVLEDVGLFAVADGMGGHTGGDRASGMAVEILEREMRKVDMASLAASGAGLGPDGDDPPGQALERAARAAGRAIYDAANADTSLAGMGTTLTAMLIFGGRLYLAHVGDSRAYLYRDDRLEQLSVDHTWIEEQVRAGFMTPEEASNSDLRHIVTRSVGYERDVRVDRLAMPTLMGDCFVLCSDGLSNYIDERELRTYMQGNYYSELPRLLVDGANQLGGEDNITCVVVYVANDGSDG
ncbi:MAG: serine/threonine-protein phosphatase [Myxococcales bacterium]|nr:serine/threonine-protein phosphatase [Myxococcales bacterium]